MPYLDSISSTTTLSELTTTIHTSNHLKPKNTTTNTPNPHPQATVQKPIHNTHKTSHHSYSAVQSIRSELFHHLKKHLAAITSTTNTSSKEQHNSRLLPADHHFNTGRPTPGPRPHCTTEAALTFARPRIDVGITNNP